MGEGGGGDSREGEARRGLAGVKVVGRQTVCEEGGIRVRLGEG